MKQKSLINLRVFINRTQVDRVLFGWFPISNNLTGFQSNSESINLRYVYMDALLMYSLENSRPATNILNRYNETVE